MRQIRVNACLFGHDLCGKQLRAFPDHALSNETGAPWAPENLIPTPNLRARVQDGDRAAVLRPAGDTVTDCDRALLAVGDRAHAGGIDALRGHEGAHRLGAAGAKRDVVFAGAAFIRMPFEGEGVPRIGLQPLYLFFQRGDRLRGQVGLVALEKHAVADIDDEVLLAARNGRARHRIGTNALVGASAHRERDRKYRGQLQSLEDTLLMFHSGASTLTSWYCHPVYRAMVKRTFRQP